MHTDLPSATAVIADNGRSYNPQSRPSAGTRHVAARQCKPTDACVANDELGTFYDLVERQPPYPIQQV